MYYIIYFLSILTYYIYCNHFITHNSTNYDMILFDIYNISKYNENVNENENNYYYYTYDDYKNVNDYTNDYYVDNYYIYDYYVDDYYVNDYYIYDYYVND